MHFHLFVFESCTVFSDYKVLLPISVSKIPERAVSLFNTRGQSWVDDTAALNSTVVYSI